MKQILTLAFSIAKLELTHYTPALLDTSQLKWWQPVSFVSASLWSVGLALLPGLLPISPGLP